MEQFANTALIQRWLPDPSEHDPSSRTHDELISSAFQCILSNFANLVKHLRGNFQSPELRSLADTLRDELERLYLWGQGLSFRTLGHLLAEDDDLSLSVLARLYELGTAILKALLPAATEVCASALEKVDSRFLGFMLEVLLRTLQEKDQDAIDYGVPQKMEHAVADIRLATDDIKALVDCLMDLAQAIEDVPIDDEAEDLSEPDVEKFMVSSVQAHVYCGRIRDRFRNAPKWLVERLGEANATRSEWISSRQPKEEQAYAVIETDKQTLTTSDLPSENVFSNFTGTSSATGSDKVFDMAALRTSSKGSSFRGLAGGEDTQSVTSLTSIGTTQSVVDQGRARVPSLPKGASDGNPFNCLVCSERVVITSRRAWKQHIFEDLKPFICTIRDCSWKTLPYAPNVSSSQAWAKHELTHRGEAWTAEMCPLCADSSTTYTTQRSFFAHLGKHLQEISLAAMPTLQHEYEEESYEDLSDIDGDVDLPMGEAYQTMRQIVMSERLSRGIFDSSKATSSSTIGTNLPNAPSSVNRTGLEPINENPCQSDAVIGVAPGDIPAPNNSTTRIADTVLSPPPWTFQPHAPRPPGNQFQQTTHGLESKAAGTSTVSGWELEDLLGPMSTHNTQHFTQGPNSQAAEEFSAPSAYDSPTKATQEAEMETSRDFTPMTPTRGEISHITDPYFDLGYTRNFDTLFHQDSQSSYYDNIWGGDLGWNPNQLDLYASYTGFDPALVLGQPSTSLNFDSPPRSGMPTLSPPTTPQISVSNADQQQPQHSPPQAPEVTPKQLFVCREPGCISKGFKRRADLKRHMDHMHDSYSKMNTYACDYENCVRHCEPFRRRDHYRDHLRDYHREDLSRQNEASEGSDWFSTRSVSKSWWRCVKCLERVSVDKYETECPRCKVTVTKGRRGARGLS